MVAHSRLSQYGINFQLKIVSSLLTNKDLLINIRDVIEPEDFDNESFKWIVKFIIKYFDKYHTCPSIEVVQIEVKKIENEILKLSIIEQLKEAYKASEEDLRYVEEEFSNFCINQQVKKALLTSVDLLQLGDYDGIKNLMGKALKAGANKNIGHIYEKDIESRYRDEDRNPIPYPWKAFNDITQGGYGKGELVLLFGSPKGGKSWVAICMAAYAAFLGHNVVYYTLELSEGYVGKRFDSVLTKIAVDQLKNHRAKVEKIIAEIKGRIVIKEFAAKRASLDSIEAHLDQLTHQYDFKPDAIFIDYLDLLKNRLAVRKEKTDDTDDVYTDARGLAREKNVPIISPSQVNRAGAQDDVIQADKVAGSYGKMMIGDVAISLSRKAKDKKLGVGRFHIMGNRFGPDGLTYFAKIDTSNGQIEINEVPLDEEEENSNNKYGKKGDFDDDDKEYLRNKFFKN